ncbi:hypothetical protein FMM05_11145 [Flavobacterium zepuense]|uniref:Uncharacterized protein n=1 Tax=Flavobacterium zepuense TaxID=2593302 RepID=A0A552V1P7_9FLAO|nr:hypothetical protein [Flavobacterium zepuense]TRW24380.1 hypothetical protein FMM05_11145 [Flavobacterium zepuense]
MNDTPKTNNEDENLNDAYGQDNSSAKEEFRKDNPDNEIDEEDAIIANSDDIDDTDKYLAIEQPGVQYTPESDPTVNSDHLNYDSEGSDGEWSEEGGNSKNSDAFNQDDYILEDNVDLDEDQNQSISSDDEDFEESNERYTN